MLKHAAHLHPLLVPPRWWQAVVTSDEAEAMARRLGLKLYRSCVKQNLNVTEGARCTACGQAAAAVE